MAAAPAFPGMFGAPGRGEQDKGCGFSQPLLGSACGSWPSLLRGVKMRRCPPGATSCSFPGRE